MRARWHAAPAAPPARVVLLRYVGRQGATVRGPASGVDYRLPATDPVQSVDVRDADALLRSGLFVRTQPHLAR